MAPETDHDSGYKQLFSHPEMVRDLLTGFVPGPWLQQARFDTLEHVNASYVSESDKHRHDDMVWRLKVGPHWVWIYLLLEFQSRPDPWMAVRMMAYVSLLAQNLIRQKQLQQGKLPGLAPFRPQLMYHLIDEARLQLSPSAEVRNLVEALFHLERSQDPQTIGRLALAVKNALQSPAHNELKRTLNRWLRQEIGRKIPVDMTGVLAHIPDLLEGAPMLAETLGRLYTEATQKGIQEGRDEGFVLMLTQLVEQRFAPVPAWAYARLHTARPDQLLLWARQILTTPDLETLFNPIAPSADMPAQGRPSPQDASSDPV